MITKETLEEIGSLYEGLQKKLGANKVQNPTVLQETRPQFYAKTVNDILGLRQKPSVYENLINLAVTHSIKKQKKS